ncbi:MAG: hypothetical protein ACRDZ2_07240 [Ilumatobacteraceae bacterium]
MLASILTLAVLPTIWLVNRADDTASPNVAAVGLSADAAASAVTSTTMPDLMGSLPPRYLNGTTGSGPLATNAPVAVGQAEQAVLGTGTATYRRDVAFPGWCLTNAYEAGLVVTIVNVNNGRSLECVTQPRDDAAPPAEEDDDADVVAVAEDELVLLTTDFAQIADLTDAPVHIEIRQ